MWDMTIGASTSKNSRWVDSTATKGRVAGWQIPGAGKSPSSQMAGVSPTEHERSGEKQDILLMYSGSLIRYLPQ